MLFLKQPHIFEVTTFQIESYKVSNSTLNPGLCNCVGIEIIESTDPLHQPHKPGNICLGHPVGLRLGLY